MTSFTKAPKIPTELIELQANPLSQNKGSYRIALLIPLCGSAGLWAPSCISSAQVAVEELNKSGGVDGRKVQLIMIDAAMEASISIEEIVNDLIERGSIDAIVGMHISAIRQRLSKVVRQRIPYVYTPLYEGGESTAGLFAIGETPKEQLGPSMELIQNQYRPKSWALIGNDYVWPRISHLFAKSRLRENAIDLAYERYVPFGSRNMAQYVAEIAASSAEAVLISLADQANDHGVCWPSVGSVATRTCLSERAVRKAIRDLEEMGHVKSNGRSGTSSYYTITPAPAAAPARDSAPAAPAPTPAPDAGEGGTSCRGPRHVVPPNRKEPSVNRQEPTERTRGCPPNVSPEVWGDFFDHRKAKRAKLTDRAAELITKKLHGLSPPQADQCLELSIENGWTGVFPERVQERGHENRSGNSQQGPGGRKTLSVSERIAVANGESAGSTFDG